MGFLWWAVGVVMGVETLIILAILADGKRRLRGGRKHVGRTR